MRFRLVWRLRKIYGSEKGLFSGYINQMTIKLKKITDTSSDEECLVVAEEIKLLENHDCRILYEIF